MLLSSSFSRFATSTCGWRQSGGRVAIGWRRSSGEIRGSLLADIASPSGGEFFGISALQFEADAGARQVWPELSVDKLRQTVEEHALDAHVVVEVLQIFQWNDGASGVRMQRGSGVAG